MMLRKEIELQACSSHLQSYVQEKVICPAMISSSISYIISSQSGNDFVYNTHPIFTQASIHEKRCPYIDEKICLANDFSISEFCDKSILAKAMDIHDKQMYILTDVYKIKKKTRRQYRYPCKRRRFKRLTIA
jgi:hypothetical protein